MVDYSVAIKKPFKDWKKLLIGIALCVVPIVRWFAKGYIFESSGVGKTKGMPNWKKWADLFVKGFAGTVIEIVYMIPAVIVFLLGAGITLAALFNAYVGKVIPVESLKGLAHGTVDINSIMPTIINNWPLAVPAIMTLVPILVLAALLGAMGNYITPMAILSYIKSGKFSDAFKLGDVFAKAFTGSYFLAWLAVGAVAVLLFFLLRGLWLFGFAITYFIVGVFAYSLFGQAFREA
jgi:hypothetical protein